MDSIPRKRKGRAAASSGGGAAHKPSLSVSSTAGIRRRKRCRETEKPSAAGIAGDGIVMTAPPAACSVAGDQTPAGPCRGLKRKLGCIESATRIGRRKKLESDYTLGEKIGHGKFGSVRLCKCRATGEEAACKSLPKGGDETAHREVEIMQHLSGHPGVVTLRAVYEDSENWYLVMELCSGGRLLDEIKQVGCFTEQRAANILNEVIGVIRYCHEMGVVHRDVKPENILFTKSRKLKLADFGLAARLANGQRLSGFAGSPAYVAPEVLSGSYNEKVDIWGAGVLLHVLLLGALPFHGDSVDTIFEAVQTAELDFNSGPWQSVSKLARDLISRMLTRDAASRLSADEVLRHPWVLFYTERPSSSAPANSRIITSRPMPLKAKMDWSRSDQESSSSCESSYGPSEHGKDDSGFVDVLAVAIRCVNISGPKRSRICSPALPSQQECSSTMKASNLCPAC